MGMGPLLDEGVRHIGAHCLRTWSFVKPLLDDGHDVRLLTLPIFEPDNPAMHTAALTQRRCEGFEYGAFTNMNFDYIHETATHLARSFAPDAIVGVNIVPAWAAARLPVAVPMWADLYGYEMTEKQGRAARTGSDESLVEAWRNESLVARRADKLSTASRPQLHALLGEMASLGRLNQYTFHYHFAHHIPSSYHPAFVEPLPALSRAVLRGVVVPQDAFVLLWSGGYNFWTDPDFLFEFTEGALAADPRIHYVSTGGAIEGYNNETYDRFRAKVEASSYRDRYHLLGWVAAEELPAIYREADLGLNIDEVNYETFFGARTRLNNLMAAGLPVMTTYGSEISQMIDEAECGVVCPPGDVAALVEGVLSLVRSPEERDWLAQRAQAFAREEFSPEKLVKPLRQWARNPVLAPDNAEKLKRSPELASFLDVALSRLEEEARVAQDYDLAALRRADRELSAIRAKWWYRVLRRAKQMISAKAQR